MRKNLRRLTEEAERKRGEMTTEEWNRVDAKAGHLADAIASLCNSENKTIVLSALLSVTVDVIRQQNAKERAFAFERFAALPEFLAEVERTA
jgi:hypothetical protein